jgi:hypothetical protein
LRLEWFLPQRLEKREAVHDRHVPVEQNNIDVRMLADLAERVFAVLGFKRFEIKVADHPSTGHADGPGIVNQQDFFHGQFPGWDSMSSFWTASLVKAQLLITGSAVHFLPPWQERTVFSNHFCLQLPTVLGTIIPYRIGKVFAVSVIGPANHLQSFP